MSKKLRPHIDNTKYCSGCKSYKDISLFNRDKKSWDGIGCRCQECRSKYRNEHWQQIHLYNLQAYWMNPDKHKSRSQTYSAQHPEEVKEKKKTYRETHSSQIQDYNAQYYADNKEQECKRTAQWKRDNPEKEKLWRTNYVKNKRATDINWRLQHDLRTRLGHAIKHNKKVGSSVLDLGCSIEFLKQYLESKFQPGMTWENWGRASNKKLTWHIDHIKPLCSFDLSDRQQFKEACHYTNLQPLWAADNLRKIIQDRQRSIRIKKKIS